MKRRKWLGLLLAAVMVLTMVPTMAFADTTETVTNENDLRTKITEATGPITIELDGDITLTSDINVGAGKNVTIIGNGHKITLNNNDQAPAAFNESASVEGLKDGTSLHISGVDFVGKAGANQGYAVIIGNAHGVNVTLDGCTFTNMHAGVYCNQVTSKGDVNNISIIGSSFDNVANYYAIDDGYTATARVDQHNVVMDGNTVATGSEEPSIETFAVASVDGVGYAKNNTYSTATAALEAAIAAAETATDKTVTLQKDVALDHMLTINQAGVTLDLNGKTINADESFVQDTNNNNNNHLIDITANDVTLKNGILEAGANNNHTLNIWNAKGVTISDLTLDNSEAELGGAPLIVGASDVTASGDIKTITGPHSWYAINVDSREVSGGKDVGAALNIKDANMIFEGKNSTGIFIEDTAEVGKENLKVTFGENVTIASKIPGFVAVATRAGANATIVTPENAGLEYENGQLVIHEHTWGEDPTTWTWAADHKTAEAVFTCTKCTDDPAATYPVEAKITSEVMKEATCEEDGVIKYIATATFEELQFIDTERVAIPATGHDFENGICTVCGAEDPNYQAAAGDQTGTEKPGDQGAPEEPTQPAKDPAYATGDDFNMAVPVAAAGLALAAMAAVVATRRRHN